MTFKDRRRQAETRGRPWNGSKALTLSCWLCRGAASRSLGFEVAEHLQAPLDLLLVRKIGALGREALALGVVTDNLHPQLVTEMIHPPRGYLEAAKRRQLVEIERRLRLYLGAAKPD